MPKLTKKELDQRRRLRTKANRENPKRIRGYQARRQLMIMDEATLLKQNINEENRQFNTTPGWLSFQALEKSPHFHTLFGKKE